ncbi:hypothetical protein [Anabaena subtropica]|uniref:Uncharacterized protein n=1 Tax=Anabaena subtropica FACHB-260 TaxID=2692884 RepID=A0ABR8CR56_9NOST|nr:hypothetical protein [Anabaena subtropica]MBD2345368.1 hypothetical protein [Anabaena subtropica FACHB-260]
MSISYGFNDSSDLLEKLRRDKKRLYDAVEHQNDIEIKDTIFDFCNTAYSLKDWLKKERHSSIEQDFNRSGTDILKVCKLICTHNKHKKSDEAESHTGLKIIRIDSENIRSSTTNIKVSSQIPITSSTIYITDDQQKKYEILQFTEEVVVFFESLLR